jgi:hypothetical protein
MGLKGSAWASLWNVCVAQIFGVAILQLRRADRFARRSRPYSRSVTKADNIVFRRWTRLPSACLVSAPSSLAFYRYEVRVCVFFVVAHVAVPRSIVMLHIGKVKKESCRCARDFFVHDALKSNAAGIHVQITKDIEREKRKGGGYGS